MAGRRFVSSYTRDEAWYPNMEDVLRNASLFFFFFSGAPNSCHCPRPQHSSFILTWQHSCQKTFHIMAERCQRLRLNWLYCIIVDDVMGSEYSVITNTSSKASFFSFFLVIDGLHVPFWCVLYIIDNK